MGIISYNKLVRDRIPEIIEQSGKQFIVRILDDNEYLSMLNAKLGEELKEYLDSGDVEELADLAEVMYAIAEFKGFSIRDFEQVRMDKQNKRGGFQKKLLLELVSEGEE